VSFTGEHHVLEVTIQHLDAKRAYDLCVKGTVMRVTTAPRGESDGVILKDGTIIKMPPPVAQQFMTLLRPDAVVAARGYGTRNQYGEALQATAFGTPDNITQLYNDLPN